MRGDSSVAPLVFRGGVVKICSDDSLQRRYSETALRDSLQSLRTKLAEEQGTTTTTVITISITTMITITTIVTIIITVIVLSLLLLVSRCLCVAH